MYSDQPLQLPLPPKNLNDYQIIIVQENLRKKATYIPKLPIMENLGQSTHQTYKLLMLALDTV